MLTCSRSCLRSPTAATNLSIFVSPRSPPKSFISITLTLKMESHPVSKRPTCQTCSKPLALCLCARLNTPCLPNKVHVTILQHSFEKKHPLNSAKIAKLGLRNLDLFSVSDVMLEARFVMRPEFGLGVAQGECTPSVCENAFEGLGSLEAGGSRKRGFHQVGELDSGARLVPKLDTEPFSKWAQEGMNEMVRSKGDGDGFYGEITDPCHGKDAKKCSTEPTVSITVGKYGEITSFTHPWKLQDEAKTSKFEDVIASPEASECLASGFTVKKLQKQQKGESIELELLEEFEIKVPPGSALLFPAEKSVSVEAVDFEVNNLIVLDGTWAKAKRMYNENPWLRALPCVKLDVNKVSLFSEVRVQPKAGYLSTIESIVYALEAFEESENHQGLHNMLNVFESMVEDQRRCKDERLNKLSSP